MIPVAMRVLLGAGCVVGTLNTARALSGPAGWDMPRPEGAQGVVGSPLAGAKAVIAIREVMGDIALAPTGGWLLVVPNDTDPFIRRYIQYQLAHLLYPRRLDVHVVDGAPLAQHIGIILAPGLELGQPWERVAERRGFVAYVWGGRR